MKKVIIIRWCVQYYERYSVSGSEYNILNHSLYKKYMDEMKKKNNLKISRSFYTCVNSKRKSPDFPYFIKFADKLSCIVDVICDIICKFFRQFLFYCCLQWYKYVPYLAHVISIPTLSDCDILMNLKNFKISFRPGPNGIASLMLVIIGGLQN